MNDRFKFRYFNKYANKMVKPENWQNVDGIYECIKQQVCFDEDIAPLPYDHIGNGLVFMQSTGLKDKNGKLIYEGDIIQIPDDYDTYGMFACEKREIYFNEGGFRLKPKWDKNSRGNWLEDTKDFEVIGNIYENKELLNEI